MADPQHCTKLFSKKLFAMESKTIENNNGVNEVDCFTLKKNCGYMSKQIQTAPKSDWLEAGKAVLDHHFEDRSHCGDGGCKRPCLSKNELEADRKASGKHYRCKKRDAKVCKCLRGIVSPFIASNTLMEIAHGHDTQINESLNNTISWMALKNKTFCGSRSLPGRVHLAVGIALVGHCRFMLGLLDWLGAEVTASVLKHADATGRKKKPHSEPHKTKEHKRKRQEATQKKVHEHIKVAENKRWKNGFYAPGEGFNMCLPVLDPRMCPHCQKKGHKTTARKMCDQNVPQVKKRAEAERRRRQEAILDRCKELNSKL